MECFSKSNEEPPQEKMEKDEGYDPIVDNERLEQFSQKLENIIPLRNFPRQDYLQETIFPILLEGMSWIIKERPEDPVESLALFLIKNDPMRPDDEIALSIDEIE